MDSAVATQATTLWDVDLGNKFKQVLALIDEGVYDAEFEAADGELLDVIIVTIESLFDHKQRSEVKKQNPDLFQLCYDGFYDKGFVSQLRPLPEHPWTWSNVAVATLRRIRDCEPIAKDPANADDCKRRTRDFLRYCGEVLLAARPN